jgi:peptidyl-prolyl cis-trans isomerase B (cyclophilin B)
MKRLFLLIVCLLFSVTLLSGCQKKINQLSKPQKGDTIAEIVVQDYGTIYVKLFADGAPKAVENFITHAREGYYNGVSFYRIFEDSILESGDPTGTGNGGVSIWGEDFEDEFNPALQPYYGALCMSNTGPDTNESRFFIVEANQTYKDELLDQIEQKYNIEFNDTARKNYSSVGGAPWFYRLNTVFGQVYQGYEVLTEISKVKKSDEELGVPAEKVTIEKIKIAEY